MLVNAIVAVMDSSSGEVSADEGLSAGGAFSSVRPLACAEVLGQSVLDRTIQRLQRSTIVKNISLVRPEGLPACSVRSSLRHRGTRLVAEPLSRWTLSEALKTQAQSGVDRVVLIRLGAYVEFDVEDLLQFHLGSGDWATRVHDHQGPLDMWMIDLSSASAISIFNGITMSDLEHSFGAGIPYACTGYVNRMKNARDLRRLVVDAFLGRCTITPGGRERRPGVWIEDSAHVHRNARVVAPAYIGGSTRVQSSALITRFSSVERNCEVGAGTAVKGSTILPYTRLGRSLCVTRSLVDGNRLTHLGRNLSVEVEDPNLLSRTVASSSPHNSAPLFASWRMRAAEVITGSLNFSEGEL